MSERQRREPTGPQTAATAVPLPPAAEPSSVMPSERPEVPLSQPPISVQGVNGLSLVGFISYAASGSTARLTADRVENASSTRTSGTLRLALWMSTGGYRQTGYRTATYSLGQLSPNTYFSNVDSGLVPWSVPPTGCYYVSMLLEEFQSSSTYAYVDYLDFTNLGSINGGCTAASCAFSLSSSSASKPSTSGTGTVDVISSPSGCSGSWSSSANASWLGIVSGGSGSGSGTTTVTYSYGANSSSSSRSGTLTLAGKTFTVNQAGTTSSSCSANATTLCLNNSRFRVTADWQTSGGQTGSGQAVLLTSETGYFWFFGSSNVEMVVKVIDACSFNNRFWVFAGGLTDVKVTMTVTDTKNGTVRTFTNPLGIAFQPIQDTNAFATCP